MTDTIKALAERLIVSARLLYANAEGCAVNHHAGDFEQQGLPGWLLDCGKDIEAFAARLAQVMPRGGVEPDWEAESLKLYRQTKMLRKALQEHHDWHLAQGDQVIEGITINGTAEYTDSGMYDRTTAILDAVLPSGIEGYEKFKEGADRLTSERGEAVQQEAGLTVMQLVDDPNSSSGKSLRSVAAPVHPRIADGGQWQTIERETIERCAKVAELRAAKYRGIIAARGGVELTQSRAERCEDYALACESVAFAIRALTPQPEHEAGQVEK